MYIRRFVLTALCLTLIFAGPPVWAHRTQARLILHLVCRSMKPTYHHEYDTQQIEAINGIELSSRNASEPGLTAFEYEMKHQCQLEGEQDTDGGPVRAWVSSLEVDFLITRMDVYISNQYQPGSCAYQVILKHENTHVAINEKLFQKSSELLAAELRRKLSIPTRQHPLMVPSLEAAQDIMEERIKRVLGPVATAFEKEDRRENGWIDTPENYRRTQALCNDW